MTKLCDVEAGCVARIKSLYCDSYLKERILALGFTKGALVEIVRKGPYDNLTVYKIRGTMIALRQEEAALIGVC